jgi:hypothetical protein
MHWHLALAKWRMHMDLWTDVEVVPPKYWDWVAVVEKGNRPPCPAGWMPGEAGCQNM